MNDLKSIADGIKHLKSAVIFTHIRPDGDTLGGALALSRALSLLKIENEVVNEGEIPDRFFTLRGADRIRLVPTLDAEGYIAIDTSDENRLGELQKIFFQGQRTGKRTFNVDHHISNTRYAQFNFVRERASNCENVAELIELLGVEFDGQIAEAIMAGVVTDSGSFSHSDVKGGTFRVAAKAADAGADVRKITYELMKRRSKARALLYARAVSSLRFYLEDRLAVAYVSQETLESFGLKQDATEGIVDFALTIDTVEVSVCMMEAKKGQYKVSFRSKGRVNVNEVAQMFGGGGHVAASGCMLFGEEEEAIDKIRYAVSQQLEF